jgi:hypothetical protein
VIQKPAKIQPALLGGLVIGLLWSVPFLNLINFCCCFGVIIGGALAAWLLIKRSPVLPVSSGDGAVVGLLAGLVGAGVYLVLGIPISLVFNQAGLSAVRSIFEQMNNPEINRAMEDAIRNSQNQGMAQRLVAGLVGWFIVSTISVGFSTVGGLIGVAIFEKRKGQQYPPQPPPSSGGFPPGYAPPGTPSAGPQPW